LNYAKVELPSTTPVVDLEDLIISPYCGPKNLKSVLTYTMCRDFNNGDFVFVRPHDPLLVFVWLGRTQNDVLKDDHNEFFKMVRVQWWVPMKKKSKLDERHFYKDY
jgi:hypothetical protein